MSQKRDKRSLSARGASAVEWVPDAWRDWVNGERNWSQLAAKYGRHRVTVKANVIRYSKALAAGYDAGPDPLAEYISGLESDLKRANRSAENPKASQPARTAAARHATEIREKLAAAKGLVTKREGREHSGQMGVDVGFSDLSDEELRELVGA